jgi:DNA N-6-adenine-methyltransferase Dam
MSTKRKNLQHPHASRQDYQTPPELLDALEERFGDFTWDCAASAENTIVPGRFFSKEGISAFDADWAKLFTPADLLFMNPEFGHIQYQWAPLVERWTLRLPWLRLIMLTPAAVGSEWYRERVEDKALVNPLNPRLAFVGEPTYPKDCMISCFGFGVAGFRVWRWKPTRAQAKAARRAKKLALVA